MARAKKAEEAHGPGVGARSRPEERRPRPSNGLARRNTNAEPEPPFPRVSDRDSLGGASRLERQIRERARLLEELNAALRASESTLRSFYESAPLMMGVVE